MQKENFSKVIKAMLCIGTLLAVFGAFIVVNCDKAYAANVITDAVITGVKEPVVGGNASETGYNLVTRGKGYSAQFFQWCNESYVPYTGTFQVGANYYALIFIKVEDGYTLLPSSRISVNEFESGQILTVARGLVVVKVGPFTVDPNQRRIDIMGDPYGVITLNKYTQKPGQLVTININEGKGRKVNSLVAYNTANNALVPIIGDGSQRAMLMPDGDVIITLDTGVASASHMSNVFVIEATHGNHGDITPEGDSYVKLGDDRNFDFIPDDGYKVADVLIDGNSIGKVEKFTFKNVKADHTIKVNFMKIGD